MENKDRFAGIDYTITLTMEIKISQGKDCEHELSEIIEQLYLMKAEEQKNCFLDSDKITDWKITDSRARYWMTHEEYFGSEE